MKQKTTIIRMGRVRLVPDIGAANPEDDLFGDVGGVISAALQVPGDDDGVAGLLADL